MRTKHFYLKVLSAFLACAMLVVSSCTDYDDDIYDINARLDSLESVTKDLPSLDAQVQVLQGISDQLEWIINYDGVGLEAKIDALLDTGSSVWADFITDLEAYYVTLEKYNTEIADYYKSADLEGDLDEYWKTNFTATNILAILEAAEISDQLYELVKTPVTDAIDDAIDAIKAEDIDGIDDVIQNFLDTLVFEDLAGDGVDVTGLTQAINALNNAYKDLNTSLSDDITQVSDDLSDLSDLVNAYTIFNDENTGLETVVSLKNVYEAIYNDATGIAAVWSAIDALEDLVGGIDVAELSALVGDVDVVALKASFDTLFDSYDAIDDTLYAFFVNKDEETGMTGLESLQDTIVLYDEIVDMIDDAVSGLREELYGTDDEMGSIASIIEGYLTYNCCSEEWATFTSAVETYLYEVLLIESFDDVFTVNNIDDYLATYLEGIKNTTEANLMTQLNSLITENLQVFIDKVNGQITDLYAKYKLAQDQIDLILSGIQTISFVPTNTANTIPVNVVDTYTFIYANILDNGDGYERELISKPISAKNTFTAKYLVQPISVAATLVEEFKSNPERFSIYEEKVSKSCSTKFEVTDVQLVCCSCCGSEKDGQIIVTIEAQDGVFSSLTEAEAYMIAFSYTGAPVTDGNENGISVASSYNELVESEISSENVDIVLIAGAESAESSDEITYSYARDRVRTIAYTTLNEVVFNATSTSIDVSNYVIVDVDGDVSENNDITVVPFFAVDQVLYNYDELVVLLADAIDVSFIDPSAAAVDFSLATVMNSRRSEKDVFFTQTAGVLSFDYVDDVPNPAAIGEIAYLSDLALSFAHDAEDETTYYATNFFSMGTDRMPIIEVIPDEVAIENANASYTWNYYYSSGYYGETDGETDLAVAGDITFANIFESKELSADDVASFIALLGGGTNDYPITIEIFGTDPETALFSYDIEEAVNTISYVVGDDYISLEVTGGAALFTNGTNGDGVATYTYEMTVDGVVNGDGKLYTVNGTLTTNYLPSTITLDCGEHTVKYVDQYQLLGYYTGYVANDTSYSVNNYSFEYSEVEDVVAKYFDVSAFATDAEKFDANYASTIGDPYYNFRYFVANNSTEEFSGIRTLNTLEEEYTDNISEIETPESNSDAVFGYQNSDATAYLVRGYYIDPADITAVVDEEGNSPSATWTNTATTLYGWDSAPTTTVTFSITVEVDFSDVLSYISINDTISVTGYYYSSENDYINEENGYSDHQNPYGFKVPSFSILDYLEVDTDLNVDNTIEYVYTADVGYNSTLDVDFEDNGNVTTYADEDGALAVGFTPYLDGVIDASAYMSPTAAKVVLTNHPITETPTVSDLSFTVGNSAVKYLTNSITLEDNRDFTGVVSLENLNSIYTYINAEGDDFYMSTSYLSGYTSEDCYDLVTDFDTSAALPNGFTIDSHGTIKYDGDSSAVAGSYPVTVTVLSPYASTEFDVNILLGE